LVWEQNCTGIVDDTRVIKPNRAEDVIRVPGFCEPTVPREQQEAIWSVRQARRKSILQARAAAKGDDGKLIEAPAPGMTLKYLLTGLVRCGHCKRAMNPVSSSAYVTKAGEVKRYTAYSCPGCASGACENNTRVPEEWLREEVVGTMRQRLFPCDSHDGREPEWLAPLFETVRQTLAARVDRHPDQRAAHKHELQQLLGQQAGWSQSLAKVDLAPSLRSVIEANWERALARQHEIEATLAEQDSRQQRVGELLDPQQVVGRLDKMPEVLALNNPTLGNLELSLHIDRIDCYQDGKVVMRTCKLGALTGAVEILATTNVQQVAPTDTNGDAAKQAKPRRRARLRVDGGTDVKAAANTAADPDRFAGLGEEWFWEDTFQIPEKTWPFQEMAIAVATERLLAERTHEELAETFGVTVPTIRKAIKYAAELDERFRDLPRKMPRSRWHEDHALEVAAKKAKNLGTNELVAFFGKSDTTIRAALAHARKISGPTQAVDGHT
jgi:predicted Rdx family selenoprotein